jgi:hypothetical protein
MSQPEIESLSHQIDPESLAVLPRTSGVYIFNGEGTLPLYIGKSVDICFNAPRNQPLNAG